MGPVRCTLPGLDTVKSDRLQAACLSDTTPKKRMASGSPPEGGIDLVGIQILPFVGIDAAGGISARTCLTPPKGGGVSARADRCGNVQG